MSKAVVAGLLAAVAVAVVLLGCKAGGEKPSESASEPQEATIVVGATSFSPESVTIEADRTVRLHFQRTAEAACAEEVVFADLDIRQPLPPNQTTTVELPPQPERTLTFACGMDMLRAQLLVQ